MAARYTRALRGDMPDPPPAHRGGFRVTEWVLGIAGVIAAFLGAFILLAGDEQYVGVGGGYSWRVGDISPAWGYGLLSGGVLLLVVSAALVLRDRGGGAPGRARPSGGADVLIHAGIFLLVNAFLWFQDIAVGGGLNYAYWVTIAWGIGLAAHVLSYFSAAHRRGPPADSGAPGGTSRREMHR